MAYILSDQNQQILADMQQFVREQVLPNAGLWDQKESMDRSVINTLAEKGWLGALAPTEFGGSEMDPLLWGHFCETIGSASSSLLGLPTVHGMLFNPSPVGALMSKKLKIYPASQRVRFWVPLR